MKTREQAITEAAEIYLEALLRREAFRALTDAGVPAIDAAVISRVEDSWICPHFAHTSRAEHSRSTPSNPL